MVFPLINHKPKQQKMFLFTLRWGGKIGKNKGENMAYGQKSGKIKLPKGKTIAVSIGCDLDEYLGWLF
ncbi:hypothetical protein [Helicobacter suis]|uniref:hypothetical protein n=1 Tax=Helicobacter suis TaxID=104628 RepID=UPI001968514F|nr:hypothetical protein [Helicobacter suis]